MQQFYQNQCVICHEIHICDKNENAPEITSEAYCVFLER